MTEILIATWDGGGNVPPALLIGRELTGRGHGVRVIGHETQRAEVAAAGLPFAVYPTAEPFVGADHNTAPRMMGLFSDLKIGADVVAEAARQRTDVVVVDCMLTGAVRSCDAAGLPYVTVEHLYDGYLRGSWLKGPMGMASRIKGRRPVRSWGRARRALVVSLADLDPGADRRKQPDNLIWTGPVLDLPAPHDLTAHPAAMLISLSTFNFPGMAEAMQNLLDATADLDARVIVTTGPVVDPGSLRTAANHEVHRFVPHDELMPQVSLVVGHGGHATTMRALAHDLPLVVMPMHPMLDQPLVGRTIERAGAGVVVAKKAKPEELRPVITRFLADGPHRAAAARLGAAIRTANGTVTAADHVLAAVGAGNGVPQA
ncbi:UDP:flavonoid glycosyltransferase YjiC (YdhE family) [Marmoricola sp. URHA0025 HA25]